MRLTAIKLAGFKSFVDPTTLTLSSNLTGVVGPNGCGKSNVIDAVRWVTGESSARQLRGTALEDVIFNGSRARKPVGRASVELKFDNSEGKLQGQYGAFSEISIKRELARDGASRYAINGTRARRRDVIDLFLGTGLGGRSNYAVIEQGAVNRLIEAKPEEMRQVLEEAAGISKYKERRRETENRIRHTRENLDRLNDLIGEVTQRLGVLKRQATNAEKYKQFKADERRLRAELLALRWADQNTHVEAAETKLREQEQALREAISAQHEARRARDEHSTAQQDAMAAVQTQQAAFYDAQAEVSRIAQALAHAREMRDMRQRERAGLVERLETLDARDNEDQQADNTAAEDQQRAESEREQAAQTRADARQALDAAEHTAREAEAAWDAQSSADHNPVQRLDAERTRARYADERLAQLTQRLESRQSERERLGTEDVDDLAAADRDIEDRAEQLANNERAAHDAATADEALQTTVVEAESRLNELRTQLGETRAQLASEKKLQQAVLREDDDSLSGWLQAHGHAGAPGVARRIQIRDEWQRAAEAVLGPWLRGFVVDALPAASQDWPSESLMLVEDATTDVAATNGGPDDLPCLADGLTAPAAIHALAARTYVVDDLPAALELRGRLHADQRLVTLDGYCVGPDSLVTPAGEAAEQGVLEREQRIARLTDHIEQQQQAFETQTETLEQQRQSQQDSRANRQRLDQSIRDARHELESARAELQGRRIRAEQLRKRRDELDTELSELADQIAAGQEESRRLAADIETLAEDAETFSAARRQAQADLAAAREQRDNARQMFERSERAMRDIDARLEQLVSRRDTLASRRADTAQARTDVAGRLAGFDAEPGESDAPQPDESEHEKAREAQARAERELRAAREALTASEDALKAGAQTLMQADQDVDARREALQQARIDVETAGVRRSGIAEQLEELGEGPAALIERLPEDADAERWSADIETLERKIQRLGAINLAAIEEYDAEAERERYLQDQHSDLSEALSTLDAAIAKIDRETRSRFKATYEQVNERFARMFPQLFGGGEAGLELTEDDWLVTGVRVMARPPGKRNASIQMLSGGEKALTAVALLFALFELNPAPFCMLDEIDAPLDDANVSRFCDLVRRMSAQVQFIVITHNKLTMELTEQLHGVTMAEPGVSRLVSVDIDQALDMAG